MLINWSMMLGAIVINGIVLPIVVRREGIWYPEGELTALGLLCG